MKTVTVSISSIVGSGICVSASDGQKVYNVISESVASGDRVQISFSGITRMTTAFLNAAVGQLYGEYSEQVVRKHLLPPIDSEPWQRNRLKMVVDRAKIFFTEDSRLRDVASQDDEGDDE
jgi:hypothetical protein